MSVELSMVVLSFAEANAEAEELSFITMVVLSASFELILFVLLVTLSLSALEELLESF